MSRNYESHPELYPWVEPTLKQIAMDHNTAFEASFAQHCREMEACTCEWDGGYGDDGSQCRRTPAPGCPTHSEEDEQ